jgi:hypothetical protein
MMSMELRMRQFAVSPNVVDITNRRRKRRRMSCTVLVVVSFLAVAATTVLLHRRNHIPEHPAVLWNQTTFSLFLDRQFLHPTSRSLGMLENATTKVMVSLPIVIQLSGEFGNHLSKIAAGVGVAALLHSYNHKDSLYQLTTSIQVRKQAHTTKGEAAMEILRTCLLHLAPLTAPDDTIPDNNPGRDLYSGINSNRDTVVDATIAQILRDVIPTSATSRPTPPETKVGDSNDTSVPFTAPMTLYSNHLVGFFDVYMDRFYDLYRELFFLRNDTADCTCGDGSNGDAPFPDEIVFYHRGYRAELPKKGLRLGFEEIPPATLVSYLTETRHYIPHDRPVAIVSRFPGAPTQPYVDALTQAGFTVRVMGRSSVPTTMTTTEHSVASIRQDFCFLRHAQQELIGPIRSTFFQWAAILRVSSSLRVTAYAMESQLLWAESASASDSAAALDSITPTYYYEDNATVNSTVWQERNFYFPLFPSPVSESPLHEDNIPP